MTQAILYSSSDHGVMQAVTLHRGAISSWQHFGYQVCSFHHYIIVLSPSYAKQRTLLVSCPEHCYSSLPPSLDNQSTSQRLQIRPCFSHTLYWLSTDEGKNPSKEKGNNCPVYLNLMRLGQLKTIWTTTAHGEMNWESITKKFRSSNYKLAGHFRSGYITYFLPIMFLVYWDLKQFHTTSVFGSNFPVTRI